MLRLSENQRGILTSIAYGLVGFAALSTQLSTIDFPYLRQLQVAAVIAAMAAGLLQKILQSPFAQSTLFTEINPMLDFYMQQSPDAQKKILALLTAITNTGIATNIPEPPTK